MNEALSDKSSFSETDKKALEGSISAYASGSAGIAIFGNGGKTDRIMGQTMFQGTVFRSKTSASSKGNPSKRRTGTLFWIAADA